MARKSLSTSEFNTLLSCMYWERIRSSAKSNKCSVVFSRRRFHNKFRHFLPKEEDVSKLFLMRFSSDEEIKRNVEIKISAFMQKVTQLKPENIENIYTYSSVFSIAHRLRPECNEHFKAAQNLNDVFLCPL